ncbi:hypothetical protein Sme01_53280 [Sphaerisporangium melleum]|uniref:DUF2795 domain-containing protein n=1 Tax=Sphaerisporangium melleum TaxID=321316 RepID=A0A917R5Q1_9ACTN|nr:DUF2795 domain-containing protein [Sphaerisporangium melleum]GGK90516.1 hypothetical protein GCM10007964_36470 [Sphaerisporangium melleum]GII72852.1 hypothetical protein Sme01_53280 [Sphaerisporangium melleum]
MTQVDFIHVQKFLSGVDYPATKEQLVEHAGKKGADEQAMQALRRLPEKEYDGPNGISKELAKS